MGRRWPGKGTKMKYTSPRSEFYFLQIAKKILRCDASAIAYHAMHSALLSALLLPFRQSCLLYHYQQINCDRRQCKIDWHQINTNTSQCNMRFPASPLGQSYVSVPW